MRRAMVNQCFSDTPLNIPRSGIPPPADTTGADNACFSELLRQYYRNRSVRKRMREFLGGTDGAKATATYIVGTDGRSGYSLPSPPSLLPEYLESGMDVERSLWDRDSLIVDIDLEYENFDSPVAAWLDPERAFGLQVPVLDATLRILGHAGLDPLILVSGRGFHLVWAIARNSRAFRRLAQLGRVPPTLEARYSQSCSHSGAKVDSDLGHAYAGLGMILEFAGHRVLAASAVACSIPVQLTAIEVGPGPGGREIVSFDISEYGDPLDGRHIRLPFSAYLKPRRAEWLLGKAGAAQLLPIFEIRLDGMTLRNAIDAARDPAKTIEIARHVATRIQDQSDSMENLIDEYRASELADFHDRFYSAPWSSEPFSAASQPGSIADAPPCVTWLLQHPNPWLLKPAALQHVARVLTALDWHPRAIAQLIFARYQTDCGWGETWTQLDPLNRAVFYTRLFTGMIATQSDKLIDLNCVSHQEKGYCNVPECFSNLVPYRNKLLERRLH
jgi:hypothetical protein